MSESSFIAGIHRFLRKSKTLSILTVNNLKIQKHKKISFGKVLRGKNSAAKEGEVSFELEFERRRILGFYMTSPKFKLRNYRFF